MKAWVIVLLGCVVGGAAVLWIWDADTPGPEEETLAKDEPLLERARGPKKGRSRAPRPRDLAGRVERLEQEVDELRRELAATRAGTSIRSRLASADSPGLDDAPGPLRDQVLEIVGEERDRDNERRTEMRRERWAERTQEIIAELKAEAGVNDEQGETLSGLWTAEADRLMPLIAAGRAGDKSWSDLREEIQSIREETDTAVKEVLSEEQYAKYDELRPRGPGRGGRRRQRPPQ